MGEAIEDGDGVRRTKDGSKEMKRRKVREGGRRNEVVEEESENEEQKQDGRIRNYTIGSK